MDDSSLPTHFAQQLEVQGQKERDPAMKDERFPKK
jgi:hypothetical protein